MNKRAMEITMNTIIIAALCLLVLIVLIFIFSSQIGSVASSLTGISEDSGRQSEKVMWDIDNLLGCKTGITTCRGNSVYECVGEKWADEPKQICSDTEKCVQKTKEQAICEPK